MDGHHIRTALLEVIAELTQNSHNALQSDSVIYKVQGKLQGLDLRSTEVQQAVLASFYDLFRMGYLSWGHDFPNCRPPFCHVTDIGKKALANLSRDPANPIGYLAALNQQAILNPIAASYLSEALWAYNSGNYKASAVMVGVATESVVLEVRDTLTSRLSLGGKPHPKGLEDWKMKTVLESMQKFFEHQRAALPKPLYERFDSYWSAFTLQIRTIRNDSGHPISIAPVSHEGVHASLLIFPDLAVLA